jgi:hypothetical protein
MEPHTVIAYAKTILGGIDILQLLDAARAGLGESLDSALDPLCDCAIPLSSAAMC